LWFRTDHAMMLTTGAPFALQMYKRQSQNYLAPEVTWETLRAMDWRGFLLILLFFTTLMVLGITALVLGPGPETTVM
jgi:hypothetical protein